jgi:hypothetical protein
MRKWLPKELLFLPVGVAIGVLIAWALNVNGWRDSESDHVREAATVYLQAFADDDPAAQRDALKDPEVTVVSIADNRAAVRYTPKLAGRGDMQLIKLRGQWLVNS